MRVVSNTSPILNLAIIDQLHLLREQMGEIHVPPAVVEELRVEESLPGSAAVRQALNDGWLQVKSATNVSLMRALIQELDAGEAAAIALAIEVGADLLLVDEREARRVAGNMNLRVTGVIGILLRAYTESRIASLDAVLTELQEKAGFFIDAELRRRVGAT